MKYFLPLILLCSALCSLANAAKVDLSKYENMNLSESEQDEVMYMLEGIKSTNEYIRTEDKETIQKAAKLAVRFTFKVTEFNGRLGGLLNPAMLNLASSIVFSPLDDSGYKFRAMLNTNGNKIIVGPYLMPAIGNFSFGLYNEDGEPLVLKTIGRLGSEINFGPRFDTKIIRDEFTGAIKRQHKSFYILEDEVQYKERIDTIKKRNAEISRRNHRGLFPVTGPFIAKGEFDAYGVNKLDYYELLPSGEIRYAGSWTSKQLGNTVLRR